MALDGGNYVNAAANSGGAIEKILAKKTPNYGMISNTASAADTNEKVSSMQAMADVQNAGITSLANTRASGFNAQATIAQGKANADAIQAEGMGNMISNIGGGIMSGLKPKFEYGKTKFGAGGGVLDGYGTLGPNYGIRQ